jgi:hypothetical protein
LCRVVCDHLGPKCIPHCDYVCDHPNLSPFPNNDDVHGHLNPSPFLQCDVVHDCLSFGPFFIMMLFVITLVLKFKAMEDLLVYQVKRSSEFFFPLY